MVSCVTKPPLVVKSTQIFPKLIPPRLKKGDTIGLIAPGSPFSDQLLGRAHEHLSKMGFKVKESKNLHAKYGYVAGSDEERIKDIHEMFRDQGINGIWCIRGGYGTSRLLPYLDYELIRNNPKVIIGYSDITALLQGIHINTGLVGFHGPVAASEMTDYTLVTNNLILRQHLQKYQIHAAHERPEGMEYIPRVIRAGTCKGELAGGNLSLLAALAGTPYQLDATGKLVFIEEVGEKPYRVDRMLTQLLQSANLDKASGIILGIFSNCEAKEDDFSLTLQQTLDDRLGKLGIPVYYGFSFGHINNMCTLPVGIKASFDTSRPVLTLLEPTVA